MVTSQPRPPLLGTYTTSCRRPLLLAPSIHQYLLKAQHHFFAYLLEYLRWAGLERGCHPKARRPRHRDPSPGFGSRLKRLTSQNYNSDLIVQTKLLDTTTWLASGGGWTTGAMVYSSFSTNRDLKKPISLLFLSDHWTRFFWPHIMEADHITLSVHSMWLAKSLALFPSALSHLQNTVLSNVFDDISSKHIAKPQLSADWVTHLLANLDQPFHLPPLRESQKCFEASAQAKSCRAVTKVTVENQLAISRFG